MSSFLEDLVKQQRERLFSLYEEGELLRLVNCPFPEALVAVLEAAEEAGTVPFLVTSSPARALQLQAMGFYCVPTVDSTIYRTYRLPDGTLAGDDIFSHVADAGVIVVDGWTSLGDRSQLDMQSFGVPVVAMDEYAVSRRGRQIH